MTEEQILQLIKEHFEEDWDENDGWEYSGNFDAFVKFAKQIYRKGKSDGYENGYDDGMCEANYSNPLEGIFSSNED